jgi:DNA repair exonuclease SbcCD ATPase subunit
MKLEIESVEFKNFLSFGSKITDVPFLRGVNLVCGLDKDRNKSNGAGKSSFLETVPFALFGQVHRNIKKEQIINWKNRKNCEVMIHFKKGKNNYTVLRAIKPDNFEIYCNDKLIDKPSHVKDYQKILNEIIGLNFSAFMSLIHSNINSSAKILSMKKPEKRKFMETMFGLSLYTRLNEKCNLKLKTINDKIREVDIGNVANEKIINSSEQRIREIQNKIRKLHIPEAELKESRENLKDIKDDFDNVSDELDEINSKIDKVLLESKRIEDIRSKIVNKCLPSVEIKVKNIQEKFKERKEVEEYIKKLKNIEKREGNKENIRKDLEKNREELTKIQETETNDLVEITEIKGKKGSFVKDLERTEKKLNLIESGICPTCGRKFNDDKLLNEERVKKISIVKEIKSLKKLWNIKNDTIKDSRKRKKEIKEKILHLKSVIDKINNYLEKIKHLDNEELFKKLEKNRQRYEKTKKSLNSVKSDIENKIGEFDRNYSILEERKSELKYIVDKTTELERKINELEKEVDSKKKMKEDLEDMVESEKRNIEKIVKQAKISSKKKSKFIELKDYLDFVKIICKDENIKQHAISSIMPYMNKQTNFYLSEVDYGFYAVLDKWLDVQIKGPGVTNASYGSLSGGESRGIDLAIQFAFLDMAKLQAGIFPDYLSFDELFDSSIDQKGITELFKIIKTKQKDENSKIFIISHRNELENADEIDNVYYVTKEKGYSKLEIK